MSTEEIATLQALASAANQAEHTIEIQPWFMKWQHSRRDVHVWADKREDGIRACEMDSVILKGEQFLPQWDEIRERRVAAFFAHDEGAVLTRDHGRREFFIDHAEPWQLR